MSGELKDILLVVLALGLAAILGALGGVLYARFSAARKGYGLSGQGAHGDAIRKTGRRTRSNDDAGPGPAHGGAGWGAYAVARRKPGRFLAKSPPPPPPPPAYDDEDTDEDDLALDFQPTQMMSFQEAQSRHLPMAPSGKERDLPALPAPRAPAPRAPATAVRTPDDEADRPSEADSIIFPYGIEPTTAPVEPPPPDGFNADPRPPDTSARPESSPGAATPPGSPAEAALPTNPRPDRGPGSDEAYPPVDSDAPDAPAPAPARAVPPVLHLGTAHIVGSPVDPAATERPRRKLPGDPALPPLDQPEVEWRDVDAHLQIRLHAPRPNAPGDESLVPSPIERTLRVVGIGIEDSERVILASDGPLCETEAIALSEIDSSIDLDTGLPIADLWHWLKTRDQTPGPPPRPPGRL